MRGFFRRLILFAIATVISSTLFAQSREYKIKAEFMERFTRFIEWPETTSGDDSPSIFHICLVGNNPFGRYLADLTAEVKIQGKSVEVSNLRETGRIQGCQLIFVDKSEASNLSSILSVTSYRPILTVSDTEGFAEKGVLINFYTAGDFIRFEINQAAVRKSGLRFSSRLLKLGRLVD
jgi:hypothetical protein